MVERHADQMGAWSVRIKGYPHPATGRFFSDTYSAYEPTRNATQRSEQLETLPQWLENAVAAAGMTAYADFDFVGNKSATVNNEQQAADPPGNVH